MMKSLISRLSACALAIGALSACAATDSQIQRAAAQSLSAEREGYAAMYAGDSATATAKFLDAMGSIDTEDKTYLDGKLYFNKARLWGNTGMLKLANGDPEGAQENFQLSQSILNNGSRDHNALLQERAEQKQGVVTALAVGAMIGLAVVGVDASSNAATQAQFNSINTSVSQAMTGVAQFADSVNAEIARAHTLDTNEEARNADVDTWRAMVVSDHPVNKSIVRIFAKSSTGGGTCTGFFIQPRIIATSAHCFGPYDIVTYEVNNPGNAWEFLSGYQGGRSVEAKYRHPGYVRVEGQLDPDDVALLVTTSPSDHWLEIEPKRFRGSAKGMVLGYPGDLDRGYFQRMDYGCAFKAGTNDWVKSNCAQYGGNSGGPYIKVVENEGETKFTAVGVLSGGPKAGKGARRADFSNVAAGMPRLADLYRKVVAQHPGAGDPKLFN